MRGLTPVPRRGHLPVMPARATAFARLRHSVLGSWLAVAYALAVLAAGLAPMPALASHPDLVGAVLCSGSVVPGAEQPAPANEQVHCKGCPVNPVLAGPPAEQLPVIARFTATVAISRPLEQGLPRGIMIGLPQSRAPPVALASRA